MKPERLVFAFILTLIITTSITSRNNNKRLIKELQQDKDRLQQQVLDMRKQYNNLHEILNKLLEDKGA